MKNFIVIALMFFVAAEVSAQNFTQNIKVSKGQKIKVLMEAKNSGSSPQGPIKTDMNFESELQFDEVSDAAITSSYTLKKAKMSFDGMGQKMDYDSENPSKGGNNMMAGAFQNLLNKPKTFNLDKQGKEVADDNKDKDQKGGRRMMMNEMGSSPSMVFLIIPEGTKSGESWRVESEESGLKTITEYTFNGLMGDLANITGKSQTKGLISQQGMSSDVNRLSTLTILVDINTGIINLETIETTDTSVVKMGDQEIKSESTSTTTISVE